MLLSTSPTHTSVPTPQWTHWFTEPDLDRFIPWVCCYLHYVERNILPREVRQQGGSLQTRDRKKIMWSSQLRPFGLSSWKPTVANETPDSSSLLAKAPTAQTPSNLLLGYYSTTWLSQLSKVNVASYLLKAQVAFGESMALKKTREICTHRGTIEVSCANRERRGQAQSSLPRGSKTWFFTSFQGIPDLKTLLQGHREQDEGS